MFENFKRITIKGGCFEQASTLELFKDKYCLSIVYGRNGSGKTTIAKAIRQYVGKDTESQTEDGYISYSVSTDANIIDDKKESVFIFDEEFVRENIRMKGRGLETIVMIGEQVNLDTLITQKIEQRNAIEKKIAEDTIRKENFENKNNISSPSYFFSQIRSKLREDGGWADIDRKIKGNSIKSSVTEDLVKRLVSMPEPKEAEAVLLQRLNSDLALFTQTQDAQIITWNPISLNIPEDLDNITALLRKKIEKPELSEREYRLLNFLQEYSDYHLQETSRQLTEERWPFCPLCLRENNEQVYVHIGDTLKHILNKESEVYNDELDKAMALFVIDEITIPVFPKLNEKEKTALQLAIEQLNKDIKIIQNRIEQRKRDIYGIVTEVFSAELILNYSAHLANFKKAMSDMENCVTTFNRSVHDREKLKNKIIQENAQLTRKQLTALLGGYSKASKAYESCLKTLSLHITDKGRIENKIKELKAQAENTDIALDYINNELQYVFYSNTKAKLVAGDGCYKLKINGRDVPPKKISVGERNVLGLCYFFARLFSNKKTNNKYTDETLIVIDDPVSSFDYGNRLGVLSLLRHQFSNINRGNSNSRILVLTHDLRSAFDLVKVRSELNGGKGTGEFFLELANKQIQKRKISNEYKNLLEEVYVYAKESANEDDEHLETSIGNVMRRLIEAFSSFCYNMSFEEMMCYEGVLNSIPKEKRTYYENFMCRLALNGESHMKERAYELNVITPYFTKQEKVQTAKSLLLFLSYLNKEHLSCYLGTMDGEDKMAVINSWKEEEATWL